jgi:hypothetical protein
MKIILYNISFMLVYVFSKNLDKYDIMQVEGGGTRWEDEKEKEGHLTLSLSCILATCILIFYL